MSHQQQPGTRATFREKLFQPNVLDVEQIILQLISDAGRSALFVNDVGDMTKTNAVYESLVLNLDAFVKPLLTAEEDRDMEVYLKKRGDIISKWPDPKGGQRPSVDLLRALFSLTVETLATQRLFKMRRYSYFGRHWKVGQDAKLEEVVREDERRGEEEELLALS